MSDDEEVAVLDGGAVRLETLAYGARIHRLVVESATGPRNVALGHAGVDDYRAATDFMGATVGRYANRIAGGRFTLDGTTYTLSRNENGNTLHGGADGFDKRTWGVVEQAADRVVYRLESPDGDQGFPGNLTATAAYRVRADGVDLELTATCDAPTIVNLTNHAYLDLAGEGQGTVDDHVITVPADRYTPIGDGLVPTGELAPVEGTPFDLRAGARLGSVTRADHPQLRLAGGLDHNLVPDGEGLRLVARVAVDGLELQVESDAPGLQVYTGNFLDGSSRSIDGRAYRQGDGLCLEPQLFPDTPNHPQFGSAVLRPGETYRHTIRWTFAPR